MMEFNQSTNYNISFNLSDIDKISADLLLIQRPAYFSWIVVSLVNLFCTIFMLVFVPKWKIYEGDLMFFLRWQLWVENCIIINSVGLATWHLTNSYLNRVETMLQTTCRFIVVSQSFFLRLISWICVWISIDRFYAVAMPKKYDLRLFDR